MGSMSLDASPIRGPVQVQEFTLDTCDDVWFLGVVRVEFAATAVITYQHELSLDVGSAFGEPLFIDVLAILILAFFVTFPGKFYNVSRRVLLGLVSAIARVEHDVARRETCGQVRCIPILPQELAKFLFFCRPCCGEQFSSPFPEAS